jgi:hypothetical protein
MLVTIANISTAQVYVMNCNIPVGGSIQTRRTWSELDDDHGLKRLLVAPAQVSLAFTAEAEDGMKVRSDLAPQVYTDGTRPNANTVTPFTAIWNSSHNLLNWSDGTHWYDAAGNQL